MKTKLAPRVAINERRAYFECFCGQLHVRTAFPSTGGFDERRPLLCLHDLAGTSASFAGLISAMGTDRSIYAIDLPGHGAQLFHFRPLTYSESFLEARAAKF